MVRASINDLPAEILVELFLITDDASSIFSLALTSQHTASVFRSSKDFILKQLCDKWSFNKYELAVLDFFRPESTLIHTSQLDFFERHPHYFGDNFAHYLWRGFAKTDRFLSPTTTNLGLPEFWRLQHTRSKMISFFNTLPIPALEKRFLSPIDVDKFILFFSVSLYQLRALHEFPSSPSIKTFYNDVKSNPSLNFYIDKRRLGDDILFDHTICSTIPEAVQSDTRMFIYCLMQILPSTPTLSFLRKFPCNSCDEAVCVKLLQRDTSGQGDRYRSDGYGGEKFNLPYGRILLAQVYGMRLYHHYKEFDITLEMRPTLKKDGTPGRSKRIVQTLTVNLEDFEKGEKFRAWQKTKIREARKSVESGGDVPENKGKPEGKPK